MSKLQERSCRDGRRDETLQSMSASVDRMISLLIPTRKRPGQLADAIRSARETAVSSRLEFCLYLDDDDHSDYSAILARTDVKYMIGPRITLSACWNKCFEISTGDILMQGNDDILF